MDVTELEPTTRQKGCRGAKKHGVPLHIIECVTRDQTLHRRRVETRIRNIPGMREISWEKVQFRAVEYQPWHDERIILHTDKSADESFEELIAKLNAL